MIILVAIIAFALAVGLKVQRVGVGVCLSLGFFSLLVSTLYLYSYFRLQGGS